MLRYLTTSFLLFLIGITAYSQNCNYDFSSNCSVYVLKGTSQSEKQKGVTQKKILSLKKCLQKSSAEKKLYWLNHRLAHDIYTTGDIDATVLHTQQAYELNPTAFCKEYISFHDSAKKRSFPFKAHYMDVVENEVLLGIKQKCLRTEMEKQPEKAKISETKSLDLKYFEALKGINKKDQQERRREKVNWDIQNRLDAENRLELDELYELYGFPSEEKVGRKGLMKAFMILHHSKDCTWNKKWTKRFLAERKSEQLDEIMYFYFFRNFNDKDGVCKEEKAFLDELLQEDYRALVKKFLNFEPWYKLFKKE